MLIIGCIMAFIRDGHAHYTYADDCHNDPFRDSKQTMHRSIP